MTCLFVRAIVHTRTASGRDNDASVDAERQTVEIAVCQSRIGFVHSLASRHGVAGMSARSDDSTPL